MISQKDIKRAAEKFSQLSTGFIALGEENRQQIVLILAEAGLEGMNVSDITSRCRLSRPAISHHLKVLKDAGLVSSYKKGTQVFYYLYLTEKLTKLKELIGLIEDIIEAVDQDELKKKAPWLRGEKGL